MEDFKPEDGRNEMTEIIFGSIILALIGVILYDKHENKKERSKLINAILSKTPEQFRDLELADKVKPIETPKKAEPEFVAESEITDKQFQEMIKKEVA